MRWRDRRAGILLGACALVAITGCVGATDRDDFNRIIEERGGGFTQEPVFDALGAVGDRLGIDPGQIELKILSITPTSELVVLEAQDPQVPQNLDRYVVHGDEIDSVEPIQVSATEDVDAVTFPAARVAFDRIEDIVDTALAEFDSEGAHVSSMNVSQWAEGQIVFQLSLESPRATGSARFDAEGQLIEVERT